MTDCALDIDIEGGSVKLLHCPIISSTVFVPVRLNFTLELFIEGLAFSVAETNGISSSSGFGDAIRNVWIFMDLPSLQGSCYSYLSRAKLLRRVYCTEVVMRRDMGGRASLR